MTNQTFTGLWLVGLLLAMPSPASAQVLPVSSVATLMSAGSRRATIVPARPDEETVGPTNAKGPAVVLDRLVFTTRHIDPLEIRLSDSSELDSTGTGESKEVKVKEQIAGRQQTAGTGHRRAWVAVLLTVLALVAVALAENR